MKRSAFIASMGMIVLLTGCAAQDDEAHTVADNVRDAANETVYKLQDWATTPTPKKKDPLPIASTYCYHTLQDILCYRQPMPGWEGRLVAYQGTNAKAPDDAVMQLLPKSKIDEALLPANRVAASKPTFTSLPELPKQADKPIDPMQAIDAAHETLPDPSQVPQL